MSIMPPHDFEEYLQFLAAVLRVRKPRQEEIFSELRDHFAERVAELKSEGADRERAAAVAQQEFGDAAALAAQFVEVIRQRKRRMVMRSTIGVISAVLVAVIATLAFWPGGHGMSPLVAEEGSQKTEAASKQTEALLASAKRDAATREKLAKPAEAEFVDMPLNSVIEYFKDYCKVQFYVKKRGLDDLSIDPNTTTVSFSLHDVPASKMLELILDNVNLDYTIQDGVVIISSPDDLESQEQLVVKVYDLRNWLGVAPSAKEVERLIDVITKTTYPQSWVEVGGVGSIESLAAPKPHSPQMRGAMGLPGAGGVPGGAMPPMAVSSESTESDSSAGATGNFQGMIVVCQSSKVHERIGNLLDQLHVALKQKEGK